MVFKLPRITINYTQLDCQIFLKENTLHVSNSKM